MTDERKEQLPTDAAQQEGALLPCPFCGGPARTFQYNGTTQATCAGKHVYCAGFDVMTTVAMWNKRAAAPKPQAVAENCVERTAQEQLRSRSSTAAAQIKHMVSRFLDWRLPENFNPDGGISFKRTFNENTKWPMKHEPTGTNLFDYTQAEAMVRYMVEGMVTADARPCTCHPDDNPPKPCPQKYALSECRAAAPKPQAVAEDALVEALRKLDELDKKRAKGPWRIGRGAFDGSTAHNVAFIVALENAWPVLRAALTKSTAQG